MSAWEAPPPPNSVGTRALVSPAARSRSKASVDSSPLMSAAAAAGRSTRAMAVARSSQSLVVGVGEGAGRVRQEGRFGLGGGAHGDLRCSSVVRSSDHDQGATGPL